MSVRTFEQKVILFEEVLPEVDGVKWGQVTVVGSPHIAPAWANGTDKHSKHTEWSKGLTIKPNEFTFDLAGYMAAVKHAMAKKYEKEDAKTQRIVKNITKNFLPVYITERYIPDEEDVMLFDGFDVLGAVMYLSYQADHVLRAIDTVNLRLEKDRDGKVWIDVNKVLRKANADQAKGETGGITKGEARRKAKAEKGGVQ